MIFFFSLERKIVLSLWEMPDAHTYRKTHTHVHTYVHTHAHKHTHCRKFKAMVPVAATTFMFTTSSHVCYH